ncbi:LIM domain only protein 3-like, partial [Centroberyx affinis]|uniref:LIM domain only protein 3-like n=1 Tax=Centroberyx affinis TaxID=166261 RepID=UPI003A5BCC10
YCWRPPGTPLKDPWWSPGPEADLSSTGRCVCSPVPPKPGTHRWLRRRRRIFGRHLSSAGMLFGVTGNCAACSKLIPAFEMVMRAKENVYHLDCFACQLCNQRFCVGDKFFLKNNMILCQTDYEEGLMKEGYAPQVR